MEYLYCGHENFEDFASGRVLYSGTGITNFPVRLLLEIYGRVRSYIGDNKDIVLYDPCCGGGYSLAVLGFFRNREIGKMYGSDIDEGLLSYARKNTALLAEGGIGKRKGEIRRLYEEYGKESHHEALQSCDRLENMLIRKINAEIFKADCTGQLPRISPDIIITDVPYGNLAKWGNGASSPLDNMLERLWDISHEKTVLAVCMDKKQKITYGKWRRLEKQNIGKRRFEILRKSELL